jgi:Putative redox-active protein (C_GCAxxG_C_C)
MDDVVEAVFSAFTRWRSLRYTSATKGNFITLSGYLHLPDHNFIRAVILMGIGSSSAGSTCGVLTGGCFGMVAGHLADIIGCEGKAEDLYARLGEFTSWFQQTFAGTACREICGGEMENIGDPARLLLKGKSLSRCLRIVGRADAKAVELMDRPLQRSGRSLVDKRLAGRGGYCASEVLAGIRSQTGIGSLYLEQVSTALDGGVGLSGGFCGAAGGAILALALADDAYDSAFSRPWPFKQQAGPRSRRIRLLQEFEQAFGSLECRDLAGRAFSDARELAAWAEKARGCAEIKDWCLREASRIIFDEIQLSSM